MGAVELAGVTKRYQARAGEVEALAPVDLTIDDGEVLAIVGPSGCGKTTLLRALAGLLEPTDGTVRIDGREIWADGRVDHDALQQVALVFQEANLLPWFSIEANVALPLRVRDVGRTERRQRARDLCALTGLGDFQRHRPAALSVGMRQRAALARALIAEPRLLLLDEPFAALDAITRDHMNTELQRIWAAYPCTTVLVTHSITEAVQLGDRVATMSSRPGRISSVLEVPFTRPRSTDVTHTDEFQRLVRQVRTALAEDWS